MTTPQKPDDGLDDILDMTPEDSPLGDSDELSEDSAPMDSYGEEANESVNGVPMYMPEDEPVETVAPRYSRTPTRIPGDRGELSSPLRAPATTADETANQRPKLGQKRMKT